MAVFSIAYTKYVQPNEGGYGWLKGDSGGETYAGIARNFNPNWPGWVAIDFEKKTKAGGQPLPNNYIVPGVQGLVNDYYRTLWDANRMSSVQNQDIANILFDMIVNAGGNGVKIMQRLLGVSVDGKMGPNTVAAINGFKDQGLLHDKYKQGRIDYYKNIAARNPENQAFLKGWIARADRFPNLTMGLIIGLPLLLVASVVFLILYNAGKH